MSRYLCSLLLRYALAVPPKPCHASVIPHGAAVHVSPEQSVPAQPRVRGLHGGGRVVPHIRAGELKIIVSAPGKIALAFLFTHETSMIEESFNTAGLQVVIFDSLGSDDKVFNFVEYDGKFDVEHKII